MDSEIDFTIRPATPEDLPQMHRIFADAKQKMRAAGNMHQWTGDYPSDAILLNDMRRGFSYIVEQEGRVVATFVLALCIEPTYDKIYEGAWLDDVLPYGTIHRIASLQGVHGVADFVIDWSAESTRNYVRQTSGKEVSNLRVDTHRDNLPMQHIMQKHGFTYCGIIYLANGDERLAYQRLTPL